jgi:LPS-assembly protein
LTHLRIRWLAASVALVFAAPHAGADDGTALRLERQILPNGPKLDRGLAKFLHAQRIEGETEKTLTATGDVELRQRGVSIRADRIDYDSPTQTVVATGGVHLDRDGDTATGPTLTYKLDGDTGEMDTPTFEVAKKADRKQAARGSAERTVLEGNSITRLFHAEYTTCPVPRSDWFLRVGELELDSAKNTGTAYNSAVYFLGVPILYSPYISFPLNNARTTGFLAPTLGTSGKSGFEFSLPWYWNIAPNRDATFTPKLLSKRGILLGGEFRYLEPRWGAGIVEAEYLPHDRIAERDRYFMGWKHSQALLWGWMGAINVQKVSDDNYFRDLSTRLAVTSQTNLPRDAIAAYSDDIWSLSARTIAYQTLQDPLAPVTEPYKQLPQFLVSGLKQDVHGLDLGLQAELTNYRHPTLVNGQRFITYPSVSWPFKATWGYVTPKAGYHFTRYNVTGDTQGLEDASRSLPIASLDAGLFFERPWNFRESSYFQTLEPRLYYLHIPYRDQSKLPNFSTADADFSFQTLFSENRFVGGDRIGDANQVTTAITSRLVESNTGIERLKVALGQIYYFEPQRVTLDKPATNDRKSDILALVAGQVTPAFTMEMGVEYNPNRGRDERIITNLRYSPAPGSIVNAAYRFTRNEVTPANQIRQVDISAQWPVGRGWNLVGRVNWSLQDRKVLEGLAGFEYNADCWALRAVAHRFTTATQQTSTSFQIQLELTGLSRIGISPLETLRQNIAGYKRSDEITP